MHAKQRTEHNDPEEKNGNAETNNPFVESRKNKAPIYESSRKINV
jgi:hypothetical protein